MTDEPDFGNWIRLRRVVGLLIASTGLLAAGAFLPSSWIGLLAMTAIAGLAMGLFLLFVYYQFDDRGGAVQQQLWSLTLDHLDGKRQGIALDVGTGNGSLAVMLATQNESLCVTGVEPFALVFASVSPLNEPRRMSFPSPTRLSTTS